MTAPLTTLFLALMLAMAILGTAVGVAIFASFAVAFEVYVFIVRGFEADPETPRPVDDALA